MFIVNKNIKLLSKKKAICVLEMLNKIRHTYFAYFDESINFITLVMSAKFYI